MCGGGGLTARGVNQGEPVGTSGLQVCGSGRGEVRG